jgi:hypothetical protein
MKLTTLQVTMLMRDVSRLVAEGTLTLDDAVELEIEAYELAGGEEVVGEAIDRGWNDERAS